MTTRRSLLAGAGGALAALSGCMGYEVRRASQAEEMRARVDELEERLDGRNETVRELRGRLNESRSRVSDLESDLGEARVGHAVDLYSVGEVAFRYGNGAWGVALDKSESGVHASAAMKFGQAYSNYGDAGDAFEATEEALEEGGMAVPDVLETAVRRARAMEEASHDMQVASVHYAYDETDEGDARWAEGREHVGAVDEIVVAAPSSFEDAVSGQGSRA